MQCLLHYYLMTAIYVLSSSARCGNVRKCCKLYVVALMRIQHNEIEAEFMLLSYMTDGEEDE